MAQISNI